MAFIITYLHSIILHYIADSKTENPASHGFIGLGCKDHAFSITPINYLEGNKEINIQSLLKEFIIITKNLGIERMVFICLLKLKRHIETKTPKDNFLFQKIGKKKIYLLLT